MKLFYILSVFIAFNSLSNAARSHEGGEELGTTNSPHRIADEDDDKAAKENFIKIKAKFGKVPPIKADQQNLFDGEWVGGCVDREDEKYYGDTRNTAVTLKRQYLPSKVDFTDGKVKIEKSGPWVWTKQYKTHAQNYTPVFKEGVLKMHDKQEMIDLAKKREVQTTTDAELRLAIGEDGTATMWCDYKTLNEWEENNKQTGKKEKKSNTTEAICIYAKAK